jgi:hypothetical protein
MLNICCGILFNVLVDCHRFTPLSSIDFASEVFRNYRDALQIQAVKIPRPDPQLLLLLWVTPEFLFDRARTRSFCLKALVAEYIVLRRFYRLANDEAKILLQRDFFGVPGCLCPKATIDLSRKNHS